MSVAQILAISLLSSTAVGGILVGFGNFLGNRSNEHLRGELAKELESARNAFELQRKELQAVLDKRHFVSRARFDAEFLAMKELHEHASKVQLAVGAVRPSISFGPANESADEFMQRVRERVTELAKGHDLLLAVQENQRPFYSEELYWAVSECSRIARIEIQQAVEPRDRLGIDWYRQGNDNSDAYSRAYAKILDLIRERIKNLEIV